MFSAWVSPKIYFRHCDKQREQGKLLIDVCGVGGRQPGRDQCGLLLTVPRASLCLGASEPLRAWVTHLKMGTKLENRTVWLIKWASQVGAESVLPVTHSQPQSSELCTVLCQNELLASLVCICSGCHHGVPRTGWLKH